MKKITKIKVQVTKEHLKRALMCGLTRLNPLSVSHGKLYNTDCAIAVAVSEVFPDVSVYHQKITVNENDKCYVFEHDGLTSIDQFDMGYTALHVRILNTNGRINKFLTYIKGKRKIISRRKAIEPFEVTIEVTQDYIDAISQKALDDLLETQPHITYVRDTPTTVS